MRTLPTSKKNQVRKIMSVGKKKKNPKKKRGRTGTVVSVMEHGNVPFDLHAFEEIPKCPWSFREL